MRRAKDLGTFRIAVLLEDPWGLISGRYDPSHIISTLHRADETWTEIFSYAFKDKRTDAIAILRIDHLDHTPGLEAIYQHGFTREVERWVDRLDDKGVAMTDSSGVTIRDKEISILKAELTQITRSKELALASTLSVTSAFNDKTFISIPLRHVVIYGSSVCDVVGDLEALDEDWRKKVGGRLTPFPSDYTMVDQAFAHISDMMIKKLTSISWDHWDHLSYGH